MVCIVIDNEGAQAYMSNIGLSLLFVKLWTLRSADASSRVLADSPMDFGILV